MYATEGAKGDASADQDKQLIWTQDYLEKSRTA